MFGGNRRAMRLRTSRTLDPSAHGGPVVILVRHNGFVGTFDLKLDSSTGKLSGSAKAVLLEPTAIML
jgi:hypothetical protein